MSNNQELQFCEPVSNFTKCKLNHLKPKKILLECGEGAGRTTFTSSDDASFQLAHVTVETTFLNRTEVLIKFSSTVRMVNLTPSIQQPGTVVLKYELLRVCNGGDPISLGIWMFDEVNVNSNYFDNIEEAFSFIYCDCLICQGCCDYFVTITPVEIDDAIATISNGRLVALSQSLCDSLEQYKALDTKNKDTKFNQNHPRPKEILLECGQGNGGIVFREPTDPPSNIAYVTIDTNCLSRPEVLIDFSSIIKLGRGLFNTILQFELFRVCDNGEPVLRGNWRFERTGANLTHELDEAFSFIFCETLTCHECCEYFVKVTVLDILSIGDASVLIDNGRMTALAQSTKDCYYHDNYEIRNEKCDCIDCKSQSLKPRRIVLECGEGTGSRTFTPSSDETPFQLAHTTIDTTYLYKPMVNIEFSSIVSFENLTTLPGDGRLRYELFRACDSRKPIALGVWSIGRRVFAGSAIDRVTNTFDFTFCDCITFPSCCEYFVTVTPIGLRGTDFTVTVSNGRMAILASDG
ncbi:DUF4489 domain-containing protein [Wukongibacter baidiensis]|uniref:DUF4489 domain-containing protein n=1 Tax=Wukongibacter baidiensis TaxID=1723361 RepID=UPI003D7F26A4